MDQALGRVDFMTTPLKPLGGKTETMPACDAPDQESKDWLALIASRMES